MSRPISAVFNALLAPLVPALGLYTLHRRFVQRKSAASLAAQWGQISPQMREFGRKSGPKVWLHAVSVGETMAARPIAAALKSEIPSVHIALSSTTDAGHEIAARFASAGEVELAFYFPLDLAPIQSRVLGALRPDAICFVETELWPNLLHLARQKGIPTFLVNGRVSDNLMKSAPRLGPIWRWMSGNVSQFLMRGQDDAARLQKLGVSPQKIVVTGDVKLEAPPISSEILRREWRAELGLSEADKVLVCGSTHDGEEAIFLELARQKPELKIAFAPRHLDRFERVAILIEGAGFEVTRRSSRQKWANGAIFLLNSVGELSDFYALADFAFVGGSLIPRGGHNLLEPTLRGVPVLFGPFVQNFLAQRDLILAHKLGEMTPDPMHFYFYEGILEWLAAPQASHAEFEVQVEKALSSHRGAAQTMARHIKAEINHRSTKARGKENSL